MLVTVQITQNWHPDFPDGNYSKQSTIPGIPVSKDDMDALISDLRQLLDVTSVSVGWSGGFGSGTKIVTCHYEPADLTFDQVEKDIISVILKYQK